MRIEVNEKGTKEFYRELVNVLMQYRKLIKNPEARLEDNFKSFRSIGIAAMVLFVINLILGLIFGWSRMVLFCTAVLWVSLLMLIVNLNRMNKAVEAYLKDTRSSVVILNDNGVALNKEGVLVFRMDWDDVAFVRAFDESVCFVPKENLGAVIAVFNTYRDEIRDYMTSNRQDVRTIM